MPSYLEQLTLRLATGVGELPEAQRERQIQYFLTAQQPDGGFAGREGASDLYYTGFGLRALAILGELRGERAHRAADFVRGRMRGQESVVDFFSLIYSGRLLELAAGVEVFNSADAHWQAAVSNWLEKLRRPDGGFAKGLEGAASSTYHTFLAMLCLELIGQPLPESERVVSFLLQQRAADGGFLEIRAQKRAGANPTAAAIASLRMLNALPAAIQQEIGDFLLDLQTEEGGIRANTRIPIADLLSTFTALLTLQDLGADHELQRDALVRFVNSMEQPQGGFQAAEWDPAHDVEYSFYGLGCLALLANQR